MTFLRYVSGHSLKDQVDVTNFRQISGWAACRLLLLMPCLAFYPEDEGDVFFRNVGLCPNYTDLQLRRLMIVAWINIIRNTYITAWSKSLFPQCLFLAQFWEGMQRRMRWLWVRRDVKWSQIVVTCFTVYTRGRENLRRISISTGGLRIDIRNCTFVSRRRGYFLYPGRLLLRGTENNSTFLPKVRKLLPHYTVSHPSIKLSTGESGGKDEWMLTFGSATDVGEWSARLHTPVMVGNRNPVAQPMASHFTEASRTCMCTGTYHETIIIQAYIYVYTFCTSSFASELSEWLPAGWQLGGILLFVQTDSGAHLASYPMATGDLSDGLKRPEREGDLT
jgi:hypothetical protein